MPDTYEKHTQTDLFDPSYCNVGLTWAQWQSLSVELQYMFVSLSISLLEQVCNTMAIGELNAEVKKKKRKEKQAISLQLVYV